MGSGRRKKPEPKDQAVIAVLPADRVRYLRMQSGLSQPKLAEAMSTKSGNHSAYGPEQVKGWEMRGIGIDALPHFLDVIDTAIQRKIDMLRRAEELERKAAQLDTKRMQSAHSAIIPA